MQKTALSYRLKQLRDARGWTIYRLAHESGVDQMTLAKLETGQSKRPQQRTLEKLARALGVGIETLDL